MFIRIITCLRCYCLLCCFQLFWFNVSSKRCQIFLIILCLRLNCFSLSFFFFMHSSSCIHLCFCALAWGWENMTILVSLELVDWQRENEREKRVLQIPLDQVASINYVDEWIQQRTIVTFPLDTDVRCQRCKLQNTSKCTQFFHCDLRTTTTWLRWHLNVYFFLFEWFFHVHGCRMH